MAEHFLEGLSLRRAIASHLPFSKIYNSRFIHKTHVQLSTLEVEKVPKFLLTFQHSYQNKSCSERQQDVRKSDSTDRRPAYGHWLYLCPISHPPQTSSPKQESLSVSNP